jgi:DUF2934 family protein
MAKRSGSQSQADDSTAGAPAAQPRVRRSRAKTAPTNGDPQARTQDAVASANMPADRQSLHLDPEPIAASRLAGSVKPADRWQPTEDDIRLRAYHRFLERGGSHGRAFDDWLEAERELRLRG